MGNILLGESFVYYITVSLVLFTTLTFVKAVKVLRNRSQYSKTTGPRTGYSVPPPEHFLFILYYVLTPSTAVKIRVTDQEEILEERYLQRLM